MIPLSVCICWSCWKAPLGSSLENGVSFGIIHTSGSNELISSGNHFHLFIIMDIVHKSAKSPKVIPFSSVIYKSVGNLVGHTGCLFYVVHLASLLESGDNVWRPRESFLRDLLKLEKLKWVKAIHKIIIYHRTIAIKGYSNLIFNVVERQA